MANKLKRPNLSSSDYLKTLKSFINSSNSTAIPPLVHDDTYYSDNAAKANFLNDFFVDQTVIDDNNASLPVPIFPEDACLNTVSITPVLQTLKLGKSSGSEYINNRNLKNKQFRFRNHYLNSLTAFLINRQCPDVWKEANVPLLYKKDDPSLVSYFRPISLLKTIGKVMEKIIHKHIYIFFQ